MNIKKILVKNITIFSYITIFALPSFAEVKDFFNRDINIPQQPKRIISLTPATTEMLFSLNLNDKIIAVTEDCNYPKETSKKNKIGKFGFIDIEKLISLKPDLIIATKDMNKQLNILKKYKIPVIAIETKDLSSVISNIKVIGKVTGKEKEGILLSEKLNNKFNQIKSNSLKIKYHPKVFYCIWHNPIMTTGKNSFVSDMIKTAGGKNISDDINASFASYNIESLISKNPDYIVITESTFKNINFSTVPWNKLKAVKNNKVIKVDDDLYSRPSSRIFDATEELQKKLAK